MTGHGRPPHLGAGAHPCARAPVRFAYVTDAIVWLTQLTRLTDRQIRARSISKMFDDLEDDFDFDFDDDFDDFDDEYRWERQARLAEGSEDDK